MEFSLLRRYLARRIGTIALPPVFLLKLWITAFAAAVLGFALKRTLGTAHPLPLAVVVLGLYVALYGGITYLWGIEESRNTVLMVLKRLRLR